MIIQSAQGQMVGFIPFSLGVIQNEGMFSSGDINWLMVMVDFYAKTSKN
jgi:hypothetical protein